ncbi:hypothetical protein KFE25_000154 [Diacronema lutheri]|uniref:Intraflagellar transport protein 52 n=2 Tax=Diacronema lutheri TaxID=2081491 RepID=A0A8J6CAD8_DIALT|nr:hypothetical protein KFE25_000154 [Diacronema lutheri]
MAELAKGICFDCSKSEAYTPQAGLKQWRRKLQGLVKIFINKDAITLDRLREAACYVFVAPQERFAPEEFEAMRAYVAEGGALMFLLAEGGETRLGTNLNGFLEEYGIEVNADSVVRTVYHKYLHPKEVYISHGILNRGINVGAGKRLGKDAAVGALSASVSEPGPNANLAFAYPYGASLTVQKPAFAVLTSGHISYPLNRPICALHESRAGGRLCVLGSSHIFEDAWFDKDENGKLAEVLVKWLLRADGVEMDPLDSDEIEVAEHKHVPDTESLAQRVRCCLEDSEEVTKDFTTLFDESLFKFDTSLIPEAVQLYKQFEVKHEPLSLIPPEFETPLPPLQPAVFPPSIREPPPPALDLFDLDDHFASERVRLAHLTNKCSEDDLDYYIREAGAVLGVTGSLPPDRRDARYVLQHVFLQIVEWKKLNQEPEAMERFRKLNGVSK